MPDRPVYAITSVDNALRLIEVLQREGTLRVTDAAAEIGVAVSTAHRLLAMLCYRGFATHGGEHRYLRGPALLGLPVRAGLAARPSSQRPAIPRVPQRAGQ